MTGRELRLDRVTETLTAKERGLLVLRSWKEGRDEDPAWRRSMPEAQTREFNRLIGLMNAVNRSLGLYLMYWQQRIELLDRDHVWLSTVLLWQVQAYTLGEYILGATKEPITESEYRELQAKAAEEFRPVADLADLLTSRHEGFSGDDLADDQAGAPHDDVIVMPQAWARVLAEKTKEIAALVAAGTLAGKGRGKALTVQAGSFYGWLGEPVPVYPEWACDYDVRPDAEADLVRARRAWREDARRAYRDGPTRLVLHHAELSDHPAFQGDGPSKINELVALTKGKLQEGVLAAWKQVRAVELLMDEIGEAFGEDPCVPAVRDALDENKTRLGELHEQAQRFGGPFELVEPSEDEVDEVRALTEREVRMAT